MHSLLTPVHISYFLLLTNVTHIDIEYENKYWIYFSGENIRTAEHVISNCCGL